MHIGSEHSREEVLDGFGFGRRRSRGIEGGPTGVQVLGTMEVYVEIENLMRRRSDLDYKQERLAAALHLDLDNS